MWSTQVFTKTQVTLTFIIWAMKREIEREIWIRENGSVLCSTVC